MICLGFVALCPPREKLKALGVHLLPLDLSEPDCKIAGKKKKKIPDDIRVNNSVPFIFSKLEV